METTGFGTTDFLDICPADVGVLLINPLDDFWKFSRKISALLGHIMHACLCTSHRNDIVNCDKLSKTTITAA